MQLTDAGSYWVQVTNLVGSTNSPFVTLTVLPDPTNAANLNLTNALVLHLPFDGDCNDISGRGNNGASVGAPVFVSPGAIGASTLEYSTTVPSSYNYVTLGVPQDLQFGSNVDFSVSYRVRQPGGSTYYDLPFFCDAINSLNNPGFSFAPGLETGGWAWTLVGAGGHSASGTGAASSINDGNWHHLVHSASRSSVLITYLDGVQVDSRSISYVGNINTPYAATIGQDPTGTYQQTAQANLDDLAVWRRALTPLEVSGIYLAGASNNVSFVPVVVVAPPPAPTTISSISGTTLSYTGGGGSQFVLLGTNNLAAPLANWTRLATNSATPGSFTIPAVGTGTPVFYRIQSE